MKFINSKILWILFFIPFVGIAQPWSEGIIQVTKDHRFLEHKNSHKPFFWLGDTGWEMFHRLTYEQTDHYLQTRANQGFNIIQAVALAEFDGLKTPNAYGQLPFKDLDPSQPNEAYWVTVDSMINLAASHHLYIGLLPTWGDKVLPLRWGLGPVIFTNENIEVSKNYGRWLANRYKSKPNIIWITGGDRPSKVGPDQKLPETDVTPVFRAMAEGIKEIIPSAFITYHTWGGSWSTSQYIHNETWLDMNSIQGSHGGKDVPIWDWVSRDLAINPPKPTLDLEPNYEDHPISFDAKNGYFRDWDVRKQIYRSVFAGGCGFTYGHHAVWQFWQSDREKINSPDRPWTEAILRPAAMQVHYLKELILRLGANNRVADQSVILTGQGEKSEYITASRDLNNKWLAVYIPEGKKISLNISELNAKNLVYRFFDPRTGNYSSPIKVNEKLSLEILCPSLGPEQDWVLLIQDKKIKLP